MSRRHAITGLLASLSIATLFVDRVHAQGPTPSAATTTNQHVSAHFTINFAEVDSATIAQLAAKLETERVRIMADLGASAAPMVVIDMHQSYADLARAMPTGLLHPGMPGFALGQDRIHVMSQSALGWSRLDDMVSYLSHELTHCLMIGRNARLENNPRWLWESVAMYEAAYRKDPKTVWYMAALQPPTFAELSSTSDGRLLDVGYTIGEFVVDRWGKPGLLKLIDANGEVERALGVSQAQFEKDWFAWVRRTYAF